MSAAKPLNRTSVAALQAEMLAAMKAVADRHGMSLAEAGYSFTPTSAKMTFEASVVSETGEALTQEREWFKQRADTYGLAQTDLDREFSHGGQTFVVTGMAPAARRMPILARELKTGGPYRFPVSTVREALAAADARKAQGLDKAA